MFVFASSGSINRNTFLLVFIFLIDLSDQTETCSNHSDMGVFEAQVCACVIKATSKLTSDARQPASRSAKYCTLSI